jgi:hypothetical protein
MVHINRPTPPDQLDLYHNGRAQHDYDYRTGVTGCAYVQLAAATPHHMLSVGICLRPAATMPFPAVLSETLLVLLVVFAASAACFTQLRAEPLL